MQVTHLPEASQQSRSLAFANVISLADAGDVASKWQIALVNQVGCRLVKEAAKDSELKMVLVSM